METNSDSDGSHISATPPRRSLPKRRPHPPPPEESRPSSLSAGCAPPVKRRLLSKGRSAPSKCRKDEMPGERPKSSVLDSSDYFLAPPESSRLPFAPVKLPSWNNPAASLSSSVMARKPSFASARFLQEEIPLHTYLDSSTKNVNNNISGENGGAKDHDNEVSLDLFRRQQRGTSVRIGETDSCQISEHLFTSAGFSPSEHAHAKYHPIEEGAGETPDQQLTASESTRIPKTQPNWISGPSGMSMKEAPKNFKSSKEGNFVRLNLNTFGRKKFRNRNAKKKYASSRFSKFRKAAPGKKHGGAANLASCSSETEYLDPELVSRPEKRAVRDGGVVEELILSVREDQSDENLKKLLKLTHGYDSFREGQLAAIKQILEGKSTMLVLPTGAGKTLCYQLTALILPGLTLVISPLVSLMMDQIRQLPSVLQGGLLCSNQTIEEANETLDQILHGRLKVLFVSPERFTDPKFLGIFQDGPSISLIVIDEVHCLSEWSHNFRPSYFRLRSSLFKTQLSVNCVLAMTATATSQTLDDIMHSLDIDPGNLIQACSMRENLELYVTISENKLKDLLSLLKSSPLNEVRSVIVYCKFQSETDTVSKYLSDNGIHAKSYHSGIPAKNRNRTQELFCSNKLRVVVATVAFGMGLNKRDVGAVIHYSLPESLEGYVQETGRAGRDGRRSFCHLLLDDSTYFKLRSLLCSDGTDEYAMNRFLCQIFDRQLCFPGETFTLLKEATSRAFDMKEEVLLTVLTQLELGEVQYIRLLPPVNVTCSLHFHKSAPTLLADKSVVVASILRQAECKHGQYVFDINTIAISLRVGPIDILNELQTLKSSGEVTMETKDPAFCYTIVSKPESIVSLSTHLTSWLRQVENSKIRKLDTIFDAATFAAKKCKQKEGCSSSLHSECMRKRIHDYFNQRDYHLSPDRPSTDETKNSPFLRADIKVFLQSNPHVKFTPRAVARIMHGIPSPAFPYSTWAETHFWGRHSCVDFSVVMRAATAELINLSGRSTV